MHISKYLVRRNTFVLIGKSVTPSNANKPNYYYNKFANKQPKPKMSNSIELLTGSPESIKVQYEYLSDLIGDCNGKTHGS